MIRVGVVGATGYAGSETVRWLLGHPEVEVVRVMSTTRSGVPLAEVVPALAGFTDLVLEPFGPCGDLDAVLLGTPHGAAKDLVPALEAPRIVDLSADHRHAPGWVYGLVEYAAEALADAPRIAVPGCFATALELGLAPLVAAGAVTGPIAIAAATGSTGAGATPKGATHHPLRFVNLKAYKVLSHQHVPEVRGFLEGLGAVPPIHFVPWSAPLDRGIFATCFVPVGEVDLAALYRDAYGAAPLVRLRPDTPELRHVRGTGLCDLSLHREEDTAVVLVALDNLGKGAAAQAVQCLNLSFGLPAHTGLALPPSTP